MPNFKQGFQILIHRMNGKLDLDQEILLNNQISHLQSWIKSAKLLKDQRGRILKFFTSKIIESLNFL